MNGRAAMPMPSRCISGRSRSARARLAPIIPISRFAEQSGLALPGRGTHRRCPADRGTDDRDRPGAAARRAAGAVVGAAAAIDAGREGARRCARRGPARHPVIGRFRRQQARGAAGRRDRSSRRTGAPGSGPRRGSGDAGQGDRCRRLQGAFEARCRGRAAQPGAACRHCRRTRGPAKNLCGRISRLCRAVESAADDGKGNSGAVVGDEAMVLFAVAEKESYVFAITQDGFDWKPFRSAPRRCRRKLRVPPRPRCQSCQRCVRQIRTVRSGACQ